MELKFFILILFATNFLSFSALEMLNFPHPEEFSFSYGQEVAYLKRSIYHEDIILIPLYYNKLPGTLLFLNSVVSNSGEY